MKKTATNRKKPFTLMEITVSLMIIALLASVMGFNIVKMIETHRIKSGLSMLAIELRQLQSLALCYKTDMELKIYKDEDGKIHYKKSSDEPLGIVNSPKPKKLHGRLYLSQNKSLVQDIRLTIHPSGIIQPAATLGFHPTEDASDEHSLWLHLQPVQLSKHQP